jgi:hypothetical protein
MPNIPHPVRQVLSFAPPLISPSLHEGAIADIAPGDTLRVRISEALRGGRLAAEGSRAASTAIYSDLTLSEGGKAVRASETAYRLTNAALPNFDRAHEALENEIARLKAKTNAPVPDTSTRSNFMASEIRQRLAGMDQTKRLAAITASINEGPAGDAVVEACLNAPSVLSGLSSTELQHIRQTWRESAIRTR